MRTIYKYPFELSETKQTISIPSTHHPLKIKVRDMGVGVPPRFIDIWCAVDTDEAPIDVEFEFIGTGQEIPKHGVYVDTFFLGEFVFHMYEIQ